MSGSRISASPSHCRASADDGVVLVLWSLVFQSKAGFEHDLIVPDLAILDVAASLDDLEPVQISQRLTGPLDRGLNGVLNAGFRRTNKFYHLVDMIRHRVLLLIITRAHSA
jgi:hypothetical protein